VTKWFAEWKLVLYMPVCTFVKLQHPMEMSCNEKFLILSRK